MDQVFLLVIDQSTASWCERNTMVFGSYERALEYFDKAVRHFYKLPEYKDDGYYVGYHRDPCSAHIAIESISDSTLYRRAYLSRYDVDDTADKPDFMRTEDD